MVIKPNSSKSHFILMPDPYLKTIQITNYYLFSFFHYLLKLLNFSCSSTLLSQISSSRTIIKQKINSYLCDLSASRYGWCAFFLRIKLLRLISR